MVRLKSIASVLVVLTAILLIAAPAARAERLCEVLIALAPFPAGAAVNPDSVRREVRGCPQVSFLHPDQVADQRARIAIQPGRLLTCDLVTVNAPLQLRKNTFGTKVVTLLTDDVPKSCAGAAATIKAGGSRVEHGHILYIEANDAFFCGDLAEVAEPPPSTQVTFEVPAPFEQVLTNLHARAAHHVGDPASCQFELE